MKNGFSLVELSIVLVILGLLTGGILSGQSLIRAAEMRAVSTEYSRYATAIGAFRDKYFAIPGDMNNATKFWGTSVGGCPGTSSTPSTTSGTCDGDGDAYIYAGAPAANEMFRFWQHLANAGMVEGNYTGVANSATASSEIAIIGTNIPRSRLSNAGWSMKGFGTIAVSDTTWVDGFYGNSFVFGALNTGWITTNAALKPEEAWNIDTKLDDGKPGTGKVVDLESQGHATNTTACSDTAASASVSMSSSSYRLDNSGVNCTLIMKSGF